MTFFDLLEVVKNWVVPKDQDLRAVLHIHVGIGVFILVACLMRRRFASVVPLLVVLVIECINEAADMRGSWELDWGWRWRDTVHDFGDTMVWPLVLFVVARWWAARDARAAQADQLSVEESSGETPVA